MVPRTVVITNQECRNIGCDVAWSHRSLALRVSWGTHTGGKHSLSDAPGCPRPTWCRVGCTKNGWAGDYDAAEQPKHRCATDSHHASAANNRKKQHGVVGAVVSEHHESGFHQCDEAEDDGHTIDHYGRGGGEHDPHRADGCTRTVVVDDDDDVSARRIWGHHCSNGGSVLLRADAGTVCGAPLPLPNHPQAANHNPAVRRCGLRIGRRAVVDFPRHRRTWRSKAMAKRWWCVRHTIAPSLRRPMLTAAPQDEPDDGVVNMYPL